MKKLNNILKATVTNLIVAFIFIVIICVTLKITIGDELTKAIALINLVSVSENTQDSENTDLKIDLEKKKLTKYLTIFYSYKFTFIRSPSSVIYSIYKS